MKMLRWFAVLLSFSGMLASIQGCAFTAGAAAGVAGDEALEHEGYDLRSPIEKEHDDD